MSLNEEIHDIEIVNSHSESHSDDDELVMIFVMTFFLFFIYPMAFPVLHSFGNEDIIFDPGIFIYHF